jgi:hypothetical protein
MNERIRELAIQSGLNAPYGSDHEGLRDFDYKKFAELIVRECAAVANINSHQWQVPGDFVLQHFGVKQ